MTFNDILTAIAEQKFTRTQVEQIIIRALHSQEESVQNGIDFQSAVQTGSPTCKLCGRKREQHSFNSQWCYYGTENKCPQGSLSRENWSQFNRRYIGTLEGCHQADAYEEV